MAPPAERFTWPPKPLPPEPSTPAASLEAAAALAAWRDAAVVPLPPVARWRFWLRDIEQTWLGQTRAPFALRAHDARWAPESPRAGAYCPRCARSVGPHEVVPDERGIARCSECRSTNIAWSRAIRLGQYRGFLRDAIHETKFSAWRRLGAELGRVLGVAINDALDADNIARDRVVLVPVPSTHRRTMARGIDHTLAIARGVRAVTALPIVRALSRLHRPSQLAVPLGERRRNVSGSMRRRSGFGLGGRIVIVIDDVMTTGATAREACRALAAPVSAGATTDPKSRSAKSRFSETGDETPRELWVAVLGVTERGDGA